MNQPKFEGLRANPFIGSLLPLNEAGKYICPPLVVAGRAAVSPSEYWRKVCNQIHAVSPDELWRAGVYIHRRIKKEGDGEGGGGDE